MMVEVTWPDMAETSRRAKLFCWCYECEYFWIPRKRKTAPHRCSECGSRKTIKATAREIRDHIRSRAREEFAKLIEGKGAPASPSEVARPQRSKKISGISESKLRTILKDFKRFGRAEQEEGENLQWLKARYRISIGQARQLLRVTT